MLPPPSPPFSESLAVVAGRMHAGVLRAGASRRVTTPFGSLYLVPTSRGALCAQLPRSLTCHRGLLRQRVTYGFWTVPGGIDLVGFAADDVTRITLLWGRHMRRATLNDNVFAVSQPVNLTSTTLPPLGRLRVDYRDRASELVRLP